MHLKQGQKTRFISIFTYIRLKNTMVKWNFEKIEFEDFFAEKRELGENFKTTHLILALNLVRDGEKQCFLTRKSFKTQKNILNL